jgi:hypothetical protein
MVFMLHQKCDGSRHDGKAKDVLIDPIATQKRVGCEGGTARDPVTNTAQLRSYEIYDALLQLKAMILASSKKAASPAKVPGISKGCATRLRCLAADARACRLALCTSMKFNDR